MRKIKTLLIYTLFTAVIVVCGIVSKDKWYNILFSAIAVVYLLLLTDGKKYAYPICSVYALGYGIISFRTGFYATAVYHVLFLLPTSVYRFILSFRKKEKATEIKSLSVMARISAVLICAALSVGLYFLLRAIGDSQPLLDGVILAISLLTSAMMFGNCLEMWWFNLAASVLYAVMWAVEFFTNGTGFAFAIMQTVVSVINVKGIVDWKKTNKIKNSPIG